MKIGSLEIDLLAEMARLRKDMQDVQGVVGGAMSSIEKAVGLAKTALVGLGGTLAGIGSIAAFKGMIDGVIEAKVQLQRLSIQTGATVESLSAIGAVSKLNGTSIEAVGAAMNKLQKNMATSTEESKGAAAAIKALGIDFDEFVRLKADQQMLAVAKAMDQFQDGGGKAAAAMMLFGKAGAQLLPMLKDLADKNELVGKTTSQSAQEAEEYEKNLKRLALAGDAWKRQMVDYLLPALVDITDAMVKARKEAGFFASIAAGLDALGNRVFDWQGNAQRKVITSLTTDLKDLNDAQAAITWDVFGQKPGIAADIEKKTKELAAAQQAYLKLTDGGAGGGRGSVNPLLPKRELPGDFGAKEKAGPKTPSDFDHFNKLTLERIALDAAELSSTEKLTQAEKERVKFLEAVDLAKITQSQREMLKLRYAGIFAMDEEIVRRDHVRKAEALDLVEMEKAYKALLAYDDVLDKNLSDLAFQSSLLGKSADEQHRLTEMRKVEVEALKAMKAIEGDPALKAVVLAQTADGQRRLNEALAEELRIRDELAGSWQHGAMQALDDYQKQIRDVAGGTAKFFTSSFQQMEDALVQFTTTGKISFGSMATSIVAGIDRIIIRQNITGPLAAALKDGIGGGGGGLFGGVGGFLGKLLGGGGGGASIGPSAGVNLFPGFAQGGDPPVGRPYWVGENGRELRIDKTPGTIIPMNAPGANPGGTSVVQQNHFHITGPMDRRTQDQIAASVLLAAQRALNRNG